MKRGLWTILGVAVACMVLASTALAVERTETLPVTSESPASGATVAPGEIKFEVTSPVAHLKAMSLEVSTSSLPGQDGTLADDFRQEFNVLTESDAFAGTYRATSLYIPGGSWWNSRPGTYYWQVSASEYQFSPPFETIHYISPVFTLTIANPAAPAPASPAPASPEEPSSVAPTLSLNEAYGTVPRVIRRKSGHNPHHLKDKCTKISSEETVCHASWWAPIPVTYRTWFYVGRFDLEAQEGETIGFAFKGAKAEYGCLRHHRVSYCTHYINW